MTCVLFPLHKEHHKNTPVLQLLQYKLHSSRMSSAFTSSDSLGFAKSCTERGFAAEIAKDLFKIEFNGCTATKQLCAKCYI